MGDVGVGGTAIIQIIKFYELLHIIYYIICRVGICSYFRIKQSTTICKYIITVQRVLQNHAK